MSLSRPARSAGARTRHRTRGALLLASVLLSVPVPGAGQLSESDSIAQLEKARDVQLRYERFREQRTPPDFATLSVRCDDVVGRYCFRFEPHEPGREWTPPEQPIELELALTRVIRDLRDVLREIPGDRWVTGQRIYYLGEAGAWRDAARVAENCRAETWWCTALLGYVFHAVGEWEEAEQIFDRALAEMPADTAAAWIEPRYILRRGADDAFVDAVAAADAKGTSGARLLEDRLWTLSDPLYLVAGNDRKTEHYARQVLIRIRSEGESGMGEEQPWGEDMDQITMQWGAPRAWTRERDRPDMGEDADFSQLTASDTRKMISHRWGLDFLPTAEALADPAELRPGDWELGERRRLELRESLGFQDQLGLSGGSGNETVARPSRNFINPEEILTAVRDAVRVSGPKTGFSPAYANRFDLLDTQIARFRRGDSLLVVGAYAPAPERDRRAGSTLTSSGSDRFLERLQPIDVRAQRGVSRTERQQARRNPFAIEEEIPEAFLADEDPPMEAGLFLIDAEWDASAPMAEVRSDQREGTFQLQVPNGRYIVGLEAFSPTEKRAWRERHGAWQESIVLGLAAMSDLLILGDRADLPESLDEALPNVLPSLRIPSGEALQVVWEVYGLEIGQTAEVRIGVNEVTVGILSTVGQFLRIIEPNNPVAMSWEEAGPDVLGTVFRSVKLDLPELEPGDYELVVEVEPRGREPMRVTRRITVVEVEEDGEDGN